MATEPQLLANRDNAQRSTGPKTPEGKERSSANSFKHGLAAAFQVLPHEDFSEFEQMLQGYYDEFEPAGYHETFLVQQMVQSRWRILRTQRLEVLFLSREAGLAEEPCPADSAILDKMRDPAVTLQRYLAAAERTYAKAHKDFTAGRNQASKTRLRNAESSIIETIYAPMPVSTPEPAKLQNEPNSPPLTGSIRAQAGPIAPRPAFVPPGTLSGRGQQPSSGPS